MKVFPDAEGRTTYDRISPSSTVQDLLDAVDACLEAHPLPCHACAESCCKKPWAVEADNVFVRRFAGEEADARGRFVRERLKLKLNRSMEFNQYVLDKKAECPFVTQENRCRVYGVRPVICRLYVCTPRDRRYDVLRGLVAATYLQALVLEENLRGGGLSQSTEVRYRRNPALHASDYSLPLAAVLDYAQNVGWLDEEDRREMR